MDINNTWIYKSEIVLDLPACLEASKGLTYASMKHILIRVMSVVLLVCVTIYAIINSLSPYVFLPALVVGGVVVMINHFRFRDGGPDYQKLLEQSGGHPPHRVYQFEADQIRSISKTTCTEKMIEYGKISQILDTGRILILKLDGGSVIIVDPRWLTGGNLDSFRRFMLEKCPNVEKLHTRAISGRWIFQISQWITAGLAILILALMVYSLIVPSLNMPGTLPETLTVTELAEELEKLDLCCDAESIELVQQWEEEYTRENYLPNSSRDRILSLLSNAGFGTYNWDTFQWTPPDSGVYWVDMEAFDVGRMYTQYLLGMEAISGGTLNFSQIEENHDGVDFESGTGTIALSFTLNGSAYSLSVPLSYDWYDLSSLEKINDILNSQDTGRFVYAASDSGQGFILFYRSKSWAVEFNTLTGIPLFSNLTDTWSSAPF